MDIYTFLKYHRNGLSANTSISNVYSLSDFSYSLLAGFPREQKGLLDGLNLILASSYFIKPFQKNTAKWKILEKQILRLAEIEDACVNVLYLNNGLGGSMVRT